MKKTMSLLAIVAFLLSCNSAGENAKTTQTETETAIDTTKTEMVATTDSTSFLYGIDISKYQGDEIDFLNKNGDTLSFVICKATEGNSEKDPDFPNNWKTIDAKGFVRGAYHFYHHNADPAQQAKHFTSVVGSFSKDDFPPIIDVEETSIGQGETTVQLVQKNLLLFLSAVKTATGRTPIIYTDHNIGNKYLSDQAFAVYPLWIADYSNKEPVKLPGAWNGKKWIMWQKSESYSIRSTTNDFDVFNGDLDDLKRILSGL